MSKVDPEEVQPEQPEEEKEKSTTPPVVDKPAVLNSSPDSSIALPGGGENPVSKSSTLGIAGDADRPGMEVASTIFQNLRRGFRSSIDKKNPEKAEFVWEKPTLGEISELCNGAIEALEKDKTLIRIDVMPCYILGDIHGNFSDLFGFLEKTGLIYGGEFIPAKFLFLGDFVDRGIHDFECVLLVLCLKVLYPNKVFLLRGNHEWAETTSMYDDRGQGLKVHIMKYYPYLYDKIFKKFMEVFGYLSVACIVNKNLFCVHGGIPRIFAENPDFNIIEALEKYPKPIAGPYMPLEEDGFFLYDLFWSDPAVGDPLPPKVPGFPEGFRDSGRNRDGPRIACTFEKATLERFLETYNFGMLIRAHESMPQGCFLGFSNKMITIFSSSGYDEENSAGVLLVYEGVIRVLMMKDDPLSGRPQSYPVP